MYYGMDGFGMGDLAMSEMGNFAEVQQPSQPIATTTDAASIGQSAAQAASLYAQYMMAQNPALLTQVQAMQPKPPAPPAGPGMTSQTKLLIGLGVGAVAVGALIWMTTRKKSSNRSKPSGDWKTIGD